MNIVLFNILVLFYAITGLSLTGNEPAVTGKETPEQQIVYNELKTMNSTDVPSYEVFELAYRGYSNLMKKQAFSKNILSIADFSKPSTEKRLWVIDMNTRKILYNDFVAHGRNSGENFAGKFSNTPNSNMSSLGFYITGETYSGKHGLSLYLNGQDPQFNDKARERAIVIHGADYVSPEYIQKYGRLGRSFGCPALSMESYRSIIGTIEQGSCLFIYYPDKEFIKKSMWLNS